LKDRDFLGDLSIDRMKIPNRIVRKNGCEGVDWTYMAHNRD
jgi:hypothetical protein